ncbi:long-chain-fatty-acid--CoA ligase [Trinickia violacea]|uniref:Long-chain-fatty-acid--CoA ligase n=1 Tax=Trinickia violacea TaxID=2571746 RepID=A0A4P8IQC7_9BURK|nr:long-chain-fatty-acid--CoA ligase [Trinickia violacea]QCP50371.1 long-chain-fatty-acid--CoA ligase [Trinickia violacea]
MLDFARMRTLPDLLAYHAEVRPDDVALDFEGRSTSYAEFHRRTDRLAASLRRLSPEPGRRIGYLGKNSDRYVELVFATAKAGLVLVPLNWRLAPDEWAFILGDAQATHLFVDDAFEAQGRALGQRLALASVMSLADEASWAALLDSYDGATPPVRADVHDIVLQIYTSGTTGTPKGVMLTHENVLALREPGLRAGLAWFPGPGDVSLVAMPVAHIAGTAYGLFGLHSGGRLVIAREFDAGEVWALLASSRASHMLLAPTALRMLLEHPAAAATRVPHLRYITYGGSPIAPALLAQAVARLNCGFTQMYGMTEASGGVVALTPDDHRKAKPHRLASAGRAMLGVELGIVDRAGARLSAGQNGEIVVRSRAVMAGYWQRPEATAETIDADGWLHTGDVGVLDEDGYLTVLDRAKDTIVSGAENVYPLEVENVLSRHPDVAEVAVIGVPSARWGEEVKAVIVPRPGMTIDAARLIDWARERIAAYKAPKSIDIVDALPRNPNGKVLRRVLRDPYWRDQERNVG